jgi:hypothetical protein
VIANQTACSPELLDALRARAEHGEARFTLVVPATPRAQGESAREHAQQVADQAAASLRAAGLEIEARIGDPDPFVAASEAWSPREFDEVFVSTMPTKASKWLQSDLPHRIARATGAPVVHVVTGLAPEPPHSEQLPHHERSGVMSALRVLTWGAREAGG